MQFTVAVWWGCGGKRGLPREFFISDLPLCNIWTVGFEKFNYPNFLDQKEFGPADDEKKFPCN